MCWSEHKNSRLGEISRNPICIIAIYYVYIILCAWYAFEHILEPVLSHCNIKRHVWNLEVVQFQFNNQTQSELMLSVRGTQYTVHSTQYTVHSTQYTVHSTQYTVHSTKYTVQSTQYTVHSTVHYNYIYPIYEDLFIQPMLSSNYI